MAQTSDRGANDECRISAPKAPHLMMVGTRNARSDRRDDFYASPPEAVIALCDVEKFVGPIWEPACGDGAISKVLVERGYDVVSTDLVPRGYGASRVDFLMEYEAGAPNIVTNPPTNWQTSSPSMRCVWHRAKSHSSCGWLGSRGGEERRF